MNFALPKMLARARQRGIEIGGALSLDVLRHDTHLPLGYFPQLTRRDLKPTPLDRLDQWSLKHTAEYLSWWEIVLLRHLLSKSVRAAHADSGEIYSRAQALHIIFRWMVHWNCGYMSLEGHAWGRNLQLRSPAMLREYVAASRRDRRLIARTDELLGVVRTGTQLSKSARATKWAHLARTLEADVCATCLRCTKQRLVRNFVRTTTLYDDSRTRRHFVLPGKIVHGRRNYANARPRTARCEFAKLGNSHRKPNAGLRAPQAGRGCMYKSFVQLSQTKQTSSMPLPC